jgi:hypothetical protein
VRVLWKGGQAPQKGADDGACATVKALTDIIERNFILAVIIKKVKKTTITSI